MFQEDIYWSFYAQISIVKIFQQKMKKDSQNQKSFLYLHPPTQTIGLYRWLSNHWEFEEILAHARLEKWQSGRMRRS